MLGLSRAGWTLNGDAAWTEDGRLRLTPAARERVGSAYATEPVRLGEDLDFAADLTVRLADPGGARDPDGPGADGMAFVLLQGRNGPESIGGAGAALGVGGGGRGERWLGIELDTWPLGVGDDDPANGNHLAIRARLDGADLVLAQTGTGALPRLNDGQPLRLRVVHDGRAGILAVWLAVGSEAPRRVLATRLDAGAILEGRSVHVGFSAGTGGGFNAHEVVDLALVAPR